MGNPEFEHGQEVYVTDALIGLPYCAMPPDGGGREPGSSGIFDGYITLADPSDVRVAHVIQHGKHVPYAEDELFPAEQFEAARQQGRVFP